MSKTITLKLDLYEYSQIEKTYKLAADKLGIDKEQMEGDLEVLTKLLEFHREQASPQETDRQENRSTCSYC